MYCYCTIVTAHDSSHPMPSRCIITVSCYKQIAMCAEVKHGIPGIPGIILYTHDIHPPIGRAILLQWEVTVTNRYLGSPSPLCHSVPCGNKQCGWSEVTRGWKQLLQLITGSLEKGGIRCLPVEYVPKSSNVHIIPEWSNEWDRVIQRKPLRYKFSKSESKWNNSICVYLWWKKQSSTC